MEFSLLSSSTVVFCGIFTLLFFLHALFNITTRAAKAHPNKLPPEPTHSWPLIGHLHLLSTVDPTHITFAKMADAYGPIFTLKLGMSRALIVSNWEIAKECFTTNDRVFASRPKLVASKLLGYDHAMIGLSPYGSHWRHVRKIVTLELFTNHRVEQLQHIRIFEVQTSIKKLYELCVKNRNNNENKALVEMKTWFGDITLNTVFRIVVGKQFSTAVDGSGNGKEDYRKTFRDYFEWFAVFVPSDLFPFLKWLDLGGHEKAMKKTAKMVDEVFDKWIEEHQQKRNFGKVEMKEQDFMDVMLSDVKDDKQPSKHDANIVTKATCLGLILAGSDTTTITMVWALSLLLNNQEVVRRAQRELDEHVGRQRQVRESDIKNLVYLQAIVKETLRLYPAAPILFPHESLKDCVVAGYHIPAGTRLIVNVQKLQRDPQIWEDPSKFHPERFLTTHKDIDVRGQNLQLIPFGSGRRMCPGISFALQLMHLTLANLLHGFEISRPSKELLDMEESVGMTSIKKNPLKVVLTPRLSAQVYE
ncbi:cytochrome P450 CYP82D47-like [Benincasa hispida]|uniref:cytochrome P450 CYP82D47-like n=1 Tax=Benincasa hispida TaxID=102211 RepID=UPI001901AA8E|nr:cytochrome P450 CYP82D47-like [Benincasa hispida]